MAVHANSLRNTLRILRQSGVSQCEFHPDGAVKAVSFHVEQPKLVAAKERPKGQRPGAEAVEALKGFGHTDAEAIAQARADGLLD